MQSVRGIGKMEDLLETEYTITVFSARDKAARYQCSSVSEHPEEMASNIVSVFMFFQEGLK